MSSPSLTSPAWPAAEPDPSVFTDADIADGLDAIQATYASEAVGPVVVIDGYGVALRVYRGELECADGIGTHRRVRRISRADAAAGQLRRVVVLGDGLVTVEAIGWCAGVGVALVVAGRDGAPLLVGTPALYDHGGLRRAQALAPLTELGMVLVRQLLDRRLADQAGITRELLDCPEGAHAIEDARAELEQATTPAEAMVAEMHAAGAYWGAWPGAVALRFAAKDRPRVPERWKTFAGRISPLGEASLNRHAASPVNALLNFGYRLAEIEATLACQALGLDPGMGLAHADRAGRPALALDLMECARGVVERTVLGLAQGRTFAKRDFTELATGEVRLVAPLTHDLATALLPALREAIAPVAEHLASELAGVALTEVRVPTALTGARRRAARAERGDVVRSRRGTASPTAQLWTCPSCGKQVTERRHVRCAACIAADPGQNATVRGVRGAAISAAKTRQAAWTRAGGAGEFDPGAWPAILDGLTGVKLADIVAATGLSKSFACTVRAGRHRPHLSHWPALAALAGRGELVATTGPAGRRQARTGAHGTGALR